MLGARPRPVRRLSALALFVAALLLAVSASFANSPPSVVASAPAPGVAVAWGLNIHGELGNGTTSDGASPVPAQVNGLNGIKAIAGGASHTVALKADGTVWAWGDNLEGQLGNGTTCSPAPCGVTAPVQVIDPADASGHLSGVIAISAGANSGLALKANGQVWTWGANGGGWLGTGTTGTAPCYCQSTPAQVLGLEGATAIAAGDGFSLALKADGGVWAWGTSSDGRLGNGASCSSSPCSISAPAQVLDPGDASGKLNGVSAIAAGDAHSLALKNGAILSWGYNADGRLGDGTTTERTTPVQVSGLSEVSAISAGYHSLALKDGAVWAWGLNLYGGLGDGTTTNRSSPVQVSGLTGVTAIAAGSYHSLALTSSGTVVAWGLNNRGELGATTVDTCGAQPFAEPCSKVPVQVGNLAGATVIGAGYEFSLALQDPAFPSAPANLAVGTVTPSSVALSWNDTASNETGFVIERKTGSGAYAQVGSTLAANTKSFTDTSVSQGATYSYRVKATNGAGSSVYSNEVSATTYRRIQEDSSSIGYLGAWPYVFDGRLSGGQAKYASATSAGATYSWTGTSVNVLSVKGPKLGKLTVTVDGVTTTADLYAASGQAQQIVFNTTVASGSHTVTIAPSGQKNPASAGFTVVLDAFDVR